MNGSERYQEASTCLLSPNGLDEKIKPNMAKIQVPTPMMQ